MNCLNGCIEKQGKVSMLKLIKLDPQREEDSEGHKHQSSKSRNGVVRTFTDKGVLTNSLKNRRT